MQKIHYRLMQASDIDAAVACLTQVFSQSEPMAACLNISKHDLADVVHGICMNSINDQLSFVAHSEHEQLIGVRLSGHYTENSLPLPNPQSMRPITALLESLHLTSPHSIDETHCIHMKMLGVIPDYRNSGVAQTLLQETLLSAKRNGINYVIVEASSSITQHIYLNKLQFELLNSVYYQTFLYQKEFVFKNMVNEKKCALLGKKI